MTTEIRYYMNKFTSGWLKNETLLLEPCDLNELSKLLSLAELNEARIAELEAKLADLPEVKE